MPHTKLITTIENPIESGMFYEHFASNFLITSMAKHSPAKLRFAKLCNSRDN